MSQKRERKALRNKAMKHAAPYRETRIQHHSDGSHTVNHTPHMKPTSKSGAFMHAGNDLSYSAGDGHELVSKLRHNLSLKDTGAESTNTEASHEEMGGEAEMDES